MFPSTKKEAKPYQNVIGKVCTNALNILDRFHVKGHLTDAWCTRAMRSKIEPTKKFVQMVRHRKLLLNWFWPKGLSSGVVEGFNNKVKLTARKVYGFQAFGFLEIAPHNRTVRLVFLKVRLEKTSGVRVPANYHNPSANSSSVLL